MDDAPGVRLPEESMLRREASASRPSTANAFMGLDVDVADERLFALNFPKGESSQTMRLDRYMCCLA